MEKPIVSIIIPVYNVEPYLNVCLEGIVNQTYKNIEIILVDDGSTDLSGSMCDEWANKDNRIKVIHKINGGLSDARNVGIENSSGEYIEFVDSDDIVNKDITEYLLKMIYELESDIAICDVVHCYPEVKPQYKCGTFNKSMTPEDAMSEIMYQKSFLFSAWGKLYKKSLFNNVRFPVGMLFEDVAVMYKLFSVAKKIAYSDSKLYGYMHRENSITTKKFDKHDCDILKICQEQLDFAKDYSKKVYNAALAYQITGAFRVYLNAPNDEYFKTYINECESIIKKNGIKVLKDPMVRRKTKIAIILFYINKKILRKAYSRIERWS